jgi:hypothetical protein
MNKLQKIYTALAVAGAVGITYVVMALKGIPSELGLEEEDQDEF